MSKFFSAVKELLVTLVVAILIAMVLKFFILDSCKILSGSMEPTLVKDDRILVFKLSYVFGEPQRGDIIIFDPPKEVDEGVEYIKRVIGLPGETIEIKEGMVYIDGEPYEEDYIAEKPTYTFGPVTVPEGEYFVLGDNRNRSADAHVWTYPFISLDDIQSKAICQYYPFSEIGLLSND
ncbi:MAG: signal peptidase I [Bacillota bacterium]|nr:signal peptidase I [Bacillota bacterium]